MTRTLASTALLVSLTSIPLFLSILTFYPELFIAHPIQHFFLGLAPWWLAYLSARWYVRLAERSSSLYHPFGCLAQCYVWVFHWVVSLYHAFFVSKVSVRTYFVTVFCAGSAVLTEGLFYNLIVIGASDPSTLGVYEKVRKSYGQALVILIRAWYLGDFGIASPQQRRRSRVRMPMHSRAMTM